MMDRDALVVGINTYTNLGNLTAAATDAEAIAQLLKNEGDFKPWRLPEEVVQSKYLQVGQKQSVTCKQLEDSLVKLFNPNSKQVPDTALFYFSGHGLRKIKGGISESFLATSDVDPKAGNWGLSLEWLRRLLKDSPIRQQIVWLDCCHSGGLLNLAETDPGDNGKSRCFIAACRDFESAWTDIDSSYSVLTKELLNGLNPLRCPERRVTNQSLVAFLSKQFKESTQRPVFSNFGEPIDLARSWQTPAIEEIQSESTICPYKGLLPFDCNESDPQYFHGRTALTSQLIDQIRQSNFVAVMGASGSGKSSLLRAGLIHQLKQGQRLSGSERWQIRIMKPGAYPLQALAQLFEDNKVEQSIKGGADELQQLIELESTEKFVLVLDQFEEVFTQCQNDSERQQFFQTLLQGLQQTPNFCLVLAMRADFFSKCLEQTYSGLAKKIQDNLVTVTPMTEIDLRAAIAEPARQVNLKIEAELIEEMIQDVITSPGSLPLLQDTLTELWKQRANSGLTLTQYSQLGGISKTLQNRADKVLESFSDEYQLTVQHIFLALTQLNEDAEDTRRRVLLVDLVNAKHPESVVNSVVQRLTAEKLIVTSETLLNNGKQRVVVIDVAHEALIRHWKSLRDWLDESRACLRQVRKLEALAIEWRDGGKKPENLLRGNSIRDTLSFQKEQTENYPLNPLVKELIKCSLKHRQNNRLRLVGFGLVVPLGLATYIGIQVERNVRIQSSWDIVNQESGKQESSSRVSALQELVQSGQPLISINLEKANLNNANLSGANLSRAKLSGAKFIRATLANADITYADLSRSTFTNGDPTGYGGSNLSGANLTGSDLSFAKLEDVMLGGANLSNTSFIGASITSSNFSGAQLASANFSKAKFDGNNFANARLNFVKFNYADLHKTIFAGADLGFAHFSHANLSNADLSKADLDHTNLSYADLSYASLQNSKKWTEKQLSSALLCQTILPFGTNLDPDRDCKALGITLYKNCHGISYAPVDCSTRNTAIPKESPSLDPPTQVWKGTAIQNNYGNYPMNLHMESRSESNFSGKLHWTTLRNSITTMDGRFVTDFGDILEQSKWRYVEEFGDSKGGSWLTFTERELLQGSGIVLGTVYYAHLKEDGTMEGVWFDDDHASEPSGKFEINLQP
jgi:uncharacterized protein YjbI with pentapeptide repeats/ABC-type branched-subunit amino acid transport system ATPase component